MEAYAVYHKNETVLADSSSGGVFTALTDYILDNGGIVVGSTYDYEQNIPRIVVCRNKEERDLLRGSIYTQAEMTPEIYRIIEKKLKDNICVLFVSTACLCNAVKKYLEVKKIDISNFYCCDILCHGVGSIGIWKNYIKMLSERHGKITKVSFKDKKKCWLKPRCIAKTETGEISTRGYSWLYFSNDIMRPSCYQCTYAKLDRGTDLTIGDFWRVKEKHKDIFNEMGTSFVLINNENGATLFDRAKNDLQYKKIEVDDCIQSNLKHPTKPNGKRSRIMSDYENLPTRRFHNKWVALLLLDKSFALLRNMKMRILK